MKVGGVFEVNALVDDCSCLFSDILGIPSPEWGKASKIRLFQVISVLMPLLLFTWRNSETSSLTPRRFLRSHKLLYPSAMQKETLSYNFYSTSSFSDKRTMQKTHAPRYAIIKIYSVQPPSKSSMKMEMNDASNANTPLEMPTLGCTPFLVGGNSQEAAFKVLIIIRFLRSSVTRRRRLFNTVSMVSTTWLKLLAAPLSCVKRAMLSLDFLPCSMTVMISAAKETSLRWKSTEH